MLVWYFVKGDNLWVYLLDNEWTGLEVWKNPAWLKVDTTKPYYSFLNKDEHIYISNCATLEEAKLCAEHYYNQYILPTTIEKIIGL